MSDRDSAILDMRIMAYKWYGAEIITGSDLLKQRKKVSSTGLKQLDKALGGGIQAGSLVEIHGLEGTGKSALALQIVKKFQRRGKNILYVDAERALCREYLSLHGITQRNLYMLNTDTLEDTFEAITTLIPGFDLIVVDTLTAIPSKAQMECTGNYLEIPDRTAKLMSNKWATIKRDLMRNDCTMIVINQEREKVGVMFGNPLFALGGRALRHYATISIDMHRVESINVSRDWLHRDVIGQTIRADIIKNKCAPPFQSAEIRMMYGNGMS